MKKLLLIIILSLFIVSCDKKDKDDQIKPIALGQLKCYNDGLYQVHLVNDTIKRRYSYDFETLRSVLEFSDTPGYKYMYLLDTIYPSYYRLSLTKQIGVITTKIVKIQSNNITIIRGY